MKVLLIDTCGEAGSVALAEGENVEAVERLAARGASATLLPVVSMLLDTSGWTLAELDGIGVVSGPGSFTGVRVGMAAAKGLCCAAGVALAAVSRLEVLAEAAGLAAGLADGCAVLDAGRGEFYVRVAVEGGEASELLCDSERLRELGQGRRMVVAEAALLERLGEFSPELRELSAADALQPVLRRLREGGSDVALADANYGRGERDIYAKAGGNAATSARNAHGEARGEQG